MSPSSWLVWREQETTLFLWLNHTAQTLLPDTAWLAITALGSSIFLLILPLAVFKPRSLEFLVFSSLAAALVSHVLKMLIGGDALRPLAVLPPSSFYLIGEPLTRSGMPSGHTVITFAFACSCYLFFKNVCYPARSDSTCHQNTIRYGLVLPIFLLAVLIGLSRIACGAHWPSDIGAGSAIGIVVAVLVWNISKKATQLFNRLPISLTSRRHLAFMRRCLRFLLWVLLVLVSCWYALGGKQGISPNAPPLNNPDVWLSEYGFSRLYAIAAILASAFLWYALRRKRFGHPQRT